MAADFRIAQAFLSKRAQTDIAIVADNPIRTVKITLPKRPTPENAPGYADTAVSAAKNIDKLSLDYSTESLETVEDILQRFHQEKVSVDKIGGALFAFGCYAGEVLIRNFGGKWKREEETEMKGFAEFFVVVELPNGVICNPVGKVFNMVMDGEKGLAYFYYIMTKEGGTKSA
jgi:hypothetical protein